MNFQIKRNILRVLPVLMLCSTGVTLTSCFDDADPASEKYKEWREKNDVYISEQEVLKNPDGTSYYTKVVPSWAPNTFVLVHWHNDTTLTTSRLCPMDNSTTQITYELFNIEGEKISDSFAKADSLYTSKPSSNIIGMWAALTRMNVGDSVTMVIPATAGYGEMSYGNILPYSTLVYNVKLKAIPAYEVP